MFAQESALFRGVGVHALEEVARESIEKQFGKGDVIFREGEPAEEFYILIEGSVEISIGEKAAINFVLGRPGEVFGWAALVEPYLRTGTASCSADCKVLSVPSYTMERVMRKYPEDGLKIMRHLMGILAQRLRFSYDSASSQIVLTAAANQPSYG